MEEVLQQLVDLAKEALAGVDEVSTTLVRNDRASQQMLERSNKLSFRTAEVDFIRRTDRVEITDAVLTGSTVGGSKEQVVVGVNRFTDASPPPKIETPDFSTLEADQKARLAAAKQRRDSSAVTAALSALRTAAEGTDPLMPPILDAVRARTTLGEISDTLRGVWGVYRPA